MLKNGIVWKDTQGNPLHAHGGYMIFHEGYYYWYGCLLYTSDAADE